MNDKMKISRPNEEEYKKAVKMLNKIFMLSFPKVLPKLYSKGQDYKEHHYIVKEEEKILGAMASVPINFLVDQEVLSCRGIGMVGTNYPARGKGVMTYMLDTAYKEALDTQTDVMFLSGNFNRYNRYGFFPSGMVNIYKLRKNKDYIKNAKEYSFVKIKGHEKEISQIKQIYDQQDVRWVREDFYKCLKTWKNKAYFIYKNGELKGYMVTSWKTHIYEIITLNTNIIEILTAWLCQMGRESVDVEVSPYLSETNTLLLEQCENFTQQTSESWSILNFRRVIEVMLKAKLKRQNLRKGRVVLEIDDDKMLIEVSDKGVSISDTTRETEASLSKELATRILFGPNIGFTTGNELLDSWLPLPIYIASSDKM